MVSAIPTCQPVAVLAEETGLWFCCFCLPLFSQVMVPNTNYVTSFLRQNAEAGKRRNSGKALWGELIKDLLQPRSVPAISASSRPPPWPLPCHLPAAFLPYPIRTPRRSLRHGPALEKPRSLLKPPQGLSWSSREDSNSPEHPEGPWRWFGLLPMALPTPSLLCSCHGGGRGAVPPIPAPSGLCWSPFRDRDQQKV